ncbi:protein kinase family protein [Neolewinella antarctica]|uniref:Serine/threonine protein kinase n=1 Tax=Neolewinella antarctica TaxID=442734 RepID=A0ABX0XGQ5_9BACT|nr:hypothetical protein [Neolewinella antarctica]NJC27932.1 serine/threonine protein kinase [Neolewinella antarctica]
MAKRYPRRLSAGANNVVIALSTTEVGKLFSDDTRSDIGSEATKLKFANQVNDLCARFIRLDINEDLNEDMLVMERLYPMEFRAYEDQIRLLWLDVFEDELKALHDSGFVHRDLCRPSGTPGLKYDNIILTQTGLRLIDVGISVLKSDVSERMFKRFIEREWEEFEIFKKDFLAR